MPGPERALAEAIRVLRPAGWLAALRASGQIDDETAAALKTEARRRVQTVPFFRHIAYASLTACKHA